MEKDFTKEEKIRRDKLKQLIKKGYNPYTISKVKRTHTSIKFKEKYKKYDKETLQGLKNPLITMTGRIKAIRSAGKVYFANIEDEYGQTQIYIKSSDVSKETFDNFIDLYIGDIISVTGKAIRTNVGELTLKVTDFQLLSKCLKSLQKDFHGFKDEEERYRRRYLDLIYNSEVKDTFIKRSKIFSLIRDFLTEKGYLEVETPILQPILGGAAAKPFITHHNTLDMPFYLRVAPEIYLKKLLVGGLEKIFEIGRLFRNEGMSSRHNPEFTSIEIYVAYEDMYFMMKLTEDLINFLVNKLFKSNEITYSKQKIIFNKEWTKISMVDAIKNVKGVEFSQNMSFEEAKNLAKLHKIALSEHHNSVGHIINLFFETFVEPTLIQPTFIYGYPVEVSPLAKENSNDLGITDRFELFINGREYANGYSELNDPIEQKIRFEKQLELRKLGDEEANEMDIDFIEALEYGMPPAGGLGIGLDRLVMLLTNQESIKDVILFPHMKNRK